MVCCRSREILEIPEIPSVAKKILFPDIVSSLQKQVYKARQTYLHEDQKMGVINKGIPESGIKESNRAMEFPLRSYSRLFVGI